MQEAANSGKEKRRRARRESKAQKCMGRQIVKEEGARENEETGCRENKTPAKTLSEE